MSWRRIATLISLFPIFHIEKYQKNAYRASTEKRRETTKEFSFCASEKANGQDDEENGCIEYGRRLLFVAEVMIAGINWNKRRTMQNHVFCMAVTLYDSNEENNVA